MMSPPPPSLKSPRFSDLVHVVREAATERALTLADLLEIVGPRGHAFACMFLCLPFLQPIPLPGLSTPFGIALMILGFLQLRGRPPHLPQRLGKIRIESATILKICMGLERLLKKVETLIQRRDLARGQSFCLRPSVLRLNGSLIILNGFLLSLPLPIPFSNNLPAITIFVLGWGMLEEDARAIFLGYVLATLTFGFFAALVILPYIASVKILEM